MPTTSPQIGVLAVQGDFERHIHAFQTLGTTPIREVRTPEQLEGITHLVLPGGESTTVGLLLERHGLGDAIRQRALSADIALWGTCMGMILLSKTIENPATVAGKLQYTLALLEITVRRNAFGAQVHSFEDAVQVNGLAEPVNAVFIRAPIVTAHGPAVTPIATYQGHCVAVQQGRILGTSFHPELTDDTRLHAHFLSL